ncbi:MAG: UpxY family transcription antiterminator [Acidobacteriota bacterium]|nr:UpxY family transcription antiterminator [Acidobacteriota bacterium]
MKNWYAVRVRSNREKAVRDIWRMKGIEEFLPVVRRISRWSDRKKTIEAPLFAGYIFCRIDPARRMPVLTTPGVVQLVGDGSGPLPVDEGELAAVRRLAESGIAAAEWSYLRAGERVAVEYGPLAGLEGIVERGGDRFRVVVSLTLLQRSVAVELEPECVRPVPGYRRAACLPPAV